MGKITQLILIDESGDTNFKLEKDSSKFFVIACVIFNNLEEAQKVSICIKDLRKKIFGNEEMEFKFYYLRNKERKKFFQTINQFDFSIYTLVIEKSKVHTNELKNKDSLYGYLMKRLLENNENDIHNASIKIDGNENRGFQSKLKNYLNEGINQDRKFVSKLRMVNSKSDSLIQLADMVAGCIRRKYEVDSSEDKENFKYISSKIKNIQNVN